MTRELTAYQNFMATFWRHLQTRESAEKVGHSDTVIVNHLKFLGFTQKLKAWAPDKLSTNLTKNCGLTLHLNISSGVKRYGVIITDFYTWLPLVTRVVFRTLTCTKIGIGDPTRHAKARTPTRPSSKKVYHLRLVELQGLVLRIASGESSSWSTLLFGLVASKRTNYPREKARQTRYNHLALWQRKAILHKRCENDLFKF